MDFNGAKAIADALLKNTSLTSLYLKYNDIGNEGTKAISDAMQTNTSITSLYIGYYWNNVNIKTPIERNQKYAKCKPSMQVFLDTSNLPDELKHIINDYVLSLVVL
jgi:hypothetical protein